MVYKNCRVIPKIIIKCRQTVLEMGKFLPTPIYSRSWLVPHSPHPSACSDLHTQKSSFFKELPYILYTHKLYVDGIGSSLPHVLTSWRDGALTRPHVSLFPGKISEGFSGHRFIVSVAHRPPYVIKRLVH